MSAYAEQYADMILPEPDADYEEWAAALEGALPPREEPDGLEGWEVPLASEEHGHEYS